MKATDIQHKTSEIDWCWKIFDEIKDELAVANIPNVVKSRLQYLVKLGLKGRQDSRED